MKKKNLLIIIISVVVLALIGIGVYLFTSDKKYTVTFDTDGGTEIKSVKVKENVEINLEDAKKDGYVFKGWYLDDTLVESPYKVVKSVTLKAHFINVDAKTVTVTFNTLNGTSIDNIILLEGETLSLPNNPEKEGYEFLGWKDENDNPIYDKVIIKSDITITAVWKKVGETGKNDVTYYCESGYDLIGDKCSKTETVEYTASKSYVCPDGSSKNPKNEKQCILEVQKSSANICKAGASRSFIKDGKRYCAYLDITIGVKDKTGKTYSEAETLELCKERLKGNVMITGIDNSVKGKEVYICAQVDDKDVKKPSKVCGKSKYKILENGLRFVCYDETTIPANTETKYCHDGYVKKACANNKCTCTKNITVLAKEK